MLVGDKRNEIMQCGYVVCVCFFKDDVIKKLVSIVLFFVCVLYIEITFLCFFVVFTIFLILFIVGIITLCIINLLLLFGCLIDSYAWLIN